MAPISMVWGVILWARDLNVQILGLITEKL